MRWSSSLSLDRSCYVSYRLDNGSYGFLAQLLPRPNKRRALFPCCFLCHCLPKQVRVGPQYFDEALGRAVQWSRSTGYRGGDSRGKDRFSHTRQTDINGPAPPPPHHGQGKEEASRAGLGCCWQSVVGDGNANLPCCPFLSLLMPSLFLPTPHCGVFCSLTRHPPPPSLSRFNRRLLCAWACGCLSD